MLGTYGFDQPLFTDLSLTAGSNVDSYITFSKRPGPMLLLKSSATGSNQSFTVDSLKNAITTNSHRMYIFPLLINSNNQTNGEQCLLSDTFTTAALAAFTVTADEGTFFKNYGGYTTISLTPAADVPTASYVSISVEFDANLFTDGDMDVDEAYVTINGVEQAYTITTVAGPIIKITNIDFEDSGNEKITSG